MGRRASFRFTGQEKKRVVYGGKKCFASMDLGARNEKEPTNKKVMEGKMKGFKEGARQKEYSYD